MNHDCSAPVPQHLMSRCQRRRAAVRRSGRRVLLMAWGVGFASLLAVAVAAGTAGAQGQSSSSGGSPDGFVFGGHYADLSPRQQVLIDDWFRRFNEAADTDLRSAVAYDAIPISVRTTFEAVTHALSHSTLTTAAGDSLGTALDLIEEVDHVKGNVPGARGDLQFRIYVQLRTDALATLEECREFTRCHDNTVFHKSYPLNYRQGKGAPSIQISMTRDGRYADIDVDYRSSFFAVALFDGHLTSANSDVRAGNNVDRHNDRWTGLSNWWRNLFGLSPSSDTAPPEEGGQFRPELPRSGRGRIEEAVADYLRSWLVEGEPHLALAYVSEQAFDCLPEEEPGTPVDRTKAIARKFRNMQLANLALGRVDSLNDVVAPEEIDDSRLVPVKHRYRDVFMLYEIPPAALDYQCGDPAPAARVPVKETVGYKKKSTGRYAASSVLHARGHRGFPVLQVWFKEAGIWRIESFRLQADPSWAAIPDVRPAIEESDDDIVRMAGDPAVIQATTAALEAWFIRRDMGASLAYMAEESFACANLDLPPGEAPFTADADLRARIKSRMERVSAGIGQPATLEEFMESVAPVSSDDRLVRHPHEKAFSLIALPDHIGVTMDCEREWNTAASTAPAEGDEKYGNHYLVAFRFRRVDEGGAALQLHWAKENGQWRIMAFQTLAD